MTLQASNTIPQAIAAIEAELAHVNSRRTLLESGLATLRQLNGSNGTPPPRKARKAVKRTNERTNERTQAEGHDEGSQEPP